MKKVSQIISSTNEQLSKLVSTEGMLVKIKHELVQLSFFKTYSEFYRLTKFSQGILYLSVSSAALATQLRHATPQILRVLQEKLPEMNVMAVQCKVSAFTKAPTQKISVYQKLKTKKISEKTKAGLEKLSETIDSKNLSDALKRLVQTKFK
ncbi:MAG: DciA family protein [Pseudomonadota bacterium]